MSTRQLARLRISLTALVMVAELAHLAWEHSHGGIVSHHLLNASDLPAISNAWGIILLPALTWFASGRVEKRAVLRSGIMGPASWLPFSVIAGFFGAMFVGILLSVAFTHGYETMAASLFLGMFVLALLLRVYRAECLLGFVLGMTFTFGAVLPTLIGSLIAVVSAVMHLGVRPLLILMWNHVTRPKSLTA